MLNNKEKERIKEKRKVQNNQVNGKERKKNTTKLKKE